MLRVFFLLSVLVFVCLFLSIQVNPGYIFPSLFPRFKQNTETQITSSCSTDDLDARTKQDYLYGTTKYTMLCAK